MRDEGVIYVAGKVRYSLTVQKVPLNHNQSILCCWSSTT